MSAAASYGLDASLFPATYRVPLWKGLQRASVYFLAFVLALFGYAHVLRTGLSAWFTIYLFAIGAILLVLVCDAIFARVVLYPDRIERITWFGKQVLARQHVKSLQQRKRGLAPFKTNVLTSKIAEDRSILLPHGIREDRAWKAWMAVARRRPE